MATIATTEAIAAYHSAETLEQDLRQLAESKPEIAELREIGRSLEDRPIWALRIGERQVSEHKLLFMGCHHAREWVSVEVPYLLAEHLVNNASQPHVRQWLQRGEIWVSPMVNPDGHEFSRTQDRLWRKNRRTNFDGSIPSRSTRLSKRICPPRWSSSSASSKRNQARKRAEKRMDAQAGRVFDPSL